MSVVRAQRTSSHIPLHNAARVGDKIHTQLNPNELLTE